jgi:hypothetical protein
MVRGVISLETECLETAIRVHEAPRAVGSHLFRLLTLVGYSADEIGTVARTLYSYVDVGDSG